MKKRMPIAVLVLLTALCCCEKNPLLPRNGGLSIQIIFPNTSPSALKKADTITLDRIHVVVFSGQKNKIIEQDLEKNGDSFVGDFKLEAGTGYSLSVDCYESNDLVYQGTESNISIRWNAVTSVVVELQGVLSRFSISENALNFNMVLIGSSLDKVVRITNTGTASLLISGITITNTAFTVNGSSSYNIAAGVYMDVTIRFSPGSATSYNAILRISNSSHESVKEIALKGTGTNYVPVTDVDGNTYKTVKIGNQWWMAENLKVTRYRNGDAVQKVTDNTTWASVTTGAYCEYNNDMNYAAIYGRLYNWYAINDGRKLAPEGWHVPSDSDWKTLEMYLGMSLTEADQTGWRGTNIGSKLKESGTLHWNNSNVDATNESGFIALPAGYRDLSGYGGIGEMIYFWSSTENSNRLISYRHLIAASPAVGRDFTTKINAFSVRCVKD